MYRSWEDCSREVVGFSGAIFKSFPSEQQAEDFIAAHMQAAAALDASLGAGASSAAPTVLPGSAPTGGSTIPRRTMFLPTSPPSVPLTAPAPLRIPEIAIQIYVDGACSGNGQQGASAGFGGYYGDDDPRNFAKPIPWDEQQSNNRGELRAIEYALAQELESAEQSGVFLPLHIHTDSKYCLDGIYLYMPAWKRNGFITTDRQPVKHQDLWKSIDRLTNDYCRRKEEVDGVPSPQPAVQFSHVKGHSDNRGNAMADMLAVQGAAMQRPRHAESATTEPPRSRGRRLEPPLQPEDVFSCSLCNILTKTTLLLPCRHVVCRSCADTIPKPRRGQDEICPCCGATVDRYVDVV